MQLRASDILTQTCIDSAVQVTETLLMLLQHWLGNLVGAFLL